MGIGLIAGNRFPFFEQFISPQLAVAGIAFGGLLFERVNYRLGIRKFQFECGIAIGHAGGAYRVEFCLSNFVMGGNQIGRLATDQIHFDVGW